MVLNIGCLSTPYNERRTMDWEGILNLLAKLYREIAVLSNALQQAQQIIAQKDQEIKSLKEHKD